MSNNVAKNPSHYEDRVKNGLPEVIQAIASALENENLSAFEGYLFGNVVKYGSRLGLKGEMFEDAEKMSIYFIWFLEEIFNRLADTENLDFEEYFCDLICDRKVIRENNL